MKKSVILLAVLSAVYGNSQVTLLPSANSFQSQWIREDNYRMTWYMLRDTAKLEIGTVSTEIYLNNGRLLQVTKVDMRRSTVPWTDSTIADLKTMAPVYHSSYNGQRDMVLQFGRVVTGYYEAKTAPARTAINDTTTSAYFDSNLYPYLITILPLGPGYKAIIPIYDYNPEKKGVMKAMVNKVTEGNYMAGPEMLREVWVVEVSDEISEGKSTYYIDKLDRRLWKQEIEAGGRKMLMVRDK